MSHGTLLFTGLLLAAYLVASRFIPTTVLATIRVLRLIVHVTAGGMTLLCLWSLVASGLIEGSAARATESAYYLLISVMVWGAGAVTRRVGTRGQPSL